MNRSEGYYATLIHELTHWSGASSRLARDMGKRFGDDAYAGEELATETGSAFLCAELGITQDVRADHAQRLAQWPKLMKCDSRAIFAAAARRPKPLHTSSASRRVRHVPHERGLARSRRGCS
jgi:antirestriction protein ArdC